LKESSDLSELCFSYGFVLNSILFEKESQATTLTRKRLADNATALTMKIKFDIMTAVVTVDRRHHHHQRHQRRQGGNILAHFCLLSFVLLLEMTTTSAAAASSGHGFKPLPRASAANASSIRSQEGDSAAGCTHAHCPTVETSTKVTSTTTIVQGKEAVECPHDATLKGYLSIAAIHADMRALGLALADVVVTTDKSFTFYLCPRETVFVKDDEPFQPYILLHQLVDPNDETAVTTSMASSVMTTTTTKMTIILSCGRKGRVLDMCTFQGGSKAQVMLELEPQSSKKSSNAHSLNVELHGITFTQFQRSSIVTSSSSSSSSSSSTSSTTRRTTASLLLSSCHWHDADGAQSAIRQEVSSSLTSSSSNSNTDDHDKENVPLLAVTLVDCQVGQAEFNDNKDSEIMARDGFIPRTSTSFLDAVFFNHGGHFAVHGLNISHVQFPHVIKSTGRGTTQVHDVQVFPSITMSSSPSDTEEIPSIITQSEGGTLQVVNLQVIGRGEKDDMVKKNDVQGEESRFWNGIVVKNGVDATLDNIAFVNLDHGPWSGLVSVFKATKKSTLRAENVKLDRLQKFGQEVEEDWCLLANEADAVLCRQKRQQLLLQQQGKSLLPVRSVVDALVLAERSSQVHVDKVHIVDSVSHNVSNTETEIECKRAKWPVVS
jgi:hypothetical protein